MAKFKINDIIQHKDYKYNRLRIIKNIDIDIIDTFYVMVGINDFGYNCRFNISYVNKMYNKVPKQQAEWIKVLYL